ncbi:MAG: hypothetical protein H6R05_250 [Burkholderiaceae bacterium]|nr:hypothetical protein [Burkholderiaceae bacterium]
MRHLPYIYKNYKQADCFYFYRWYDCTYSDYICQLLLGGATVGSIRKKTVSKDRVLGQHLLLLVLIKMVVLYGLWSVFIKPNKVKVDVSDVQRLYQGGSAAPPAIEFNQNQRSQP